MLRPTDLPANARVLNPPSRDMPPEIEDQIRKHPSFEPSYEHDRYKEYRELWQLYLDLLEPDGVKVRKMVEKHNKDEDPEKFKMRQDLAVAFNLVPTLANMLKGYLFAEEPNIEVNGDTDLEAFTDSCDGCGTGFIQYCRETVLPLCMAMGYLDVLIQNPLVVGDIRTKADAIEKNAKPTAFAITPLQRINWSSTLQGQYNWICFTDLGSENPYPLFRNLQIPISYITVSANNDQFPNDAGKGIWIRSWHPWYINQDGKVPEQATAGQIISPTPEANPTMSGQYFHEADYNPTRDVPLATIYWQKSNDPKMRHMGVSKIAMIALLTKKIINVLSWLDEDVLANLSVLLVPTKGGQPPESKDGKPVLQNLSAFSALYYDKESHHPPSRLEGDVAHIKVKLEMIEFYILEILRLSHLTFGSQARAERVSSGVQAVVQRNELFRELQDTAGNLDRFALDVFALVKSWATGEEVTTEQLTKAGVTASFNKGPYLTDTAADAIDQAAALIAMLRNVSSTACVEAYKNAAQQYFSAQNPKLQQVMQEIEQHAPAQLAADSEAALLAEAAAIAQSKFGGMLNIKETAGGESADDTTLANPAGGEKPPTPGAQKPA